LTTIGIAAAPTATMTLSYEKRFSTDGLSGDYIFTIIPGVDLTFDSRIYIQFNPVDYAARLNKLGQIECQIDFRLEHHTVQCEVIYDLTVKVWINEEISDA
jgi:hypothetical protein